MFNLDMFQSRMKRIDISYKLIEFISGRRSSADTVVNVARQSSGLEPLY